MAVTVERLREAADVFVNVRIDTYLLGAGGADGIFVPCTGDPDVIAELVAGIDAPLNAARRPRRPWRSCRGWASPAPARARRPR